MSSPLPLLEVESKAVAMKLPGLFKKNTAQGRVPTPSKKSATRTNQAGNVDGPQRIDEDEDVVGTGSGAGEARKKLGSDLTFSAATSNPLADRAHIINKDSLDQKVLAGPGSLDPGTLAPPAVPDARRWLAKRGMELLVPEGWRFMGAQHEGRGISFNHTGTAEGHGIEVATWRLADDTPLGSFLQPYLEEAEDLVRLGRLAGHEKQKLGEVDGVLLVGWGPDTAAALGVADQEALFLATDGTGRRSMSWRGAVQRSGENHLYIVSFTSPIESFFEAKAVYDAVLKSARILS
jgi:hypothetical protein